MTYYTEIRQVITDSKTIEYELTRKPVKNINLRIKSSGKVYVSANKDVPANYIDNFIKEKQDYIINALDKYEEKRKNSSTRDKKFINGEIFNILGKKLALKIIIGDKELVAWDEEYIYLTVNDKNQHNIIYKKVLINKWLNDLTTDTFREICQETYEKFKKYGVKYPNRITIRYMTSRWGSCRPRKGNITLNIKLIEAPRECIEYVVIHEFAHFIHPNHSKDFHVLVEEFMPNWKKWKKELDQIYL